MGIRAAYGKKEDIYAAISLGIIPKESIIFTNDTDSTSEIFFLDAQGVLKDATQADRLDELTQTAAAQKAAIEAESEERSQGDADILALIEQLGARHTQDIAELLQNAEALSAGFDELTERTTATESRLQSFAEALSVLEGGAKTTAERLDTLQGRIENLEKGGTDERLSGIEGDIERLNAEKLSEGDITELEGKSVQDAFDEIFG